MISGSGNDDQRVMDQCTTEYAALESVLLMCDHAGHEGAVGTICDYKEQLKFLVKLGISSMFKDGDKGEM